MLGDPITYLTIAMEANYFQLRRVEYHVPVVMRIPRIELALARRGGAERTRRVALPLKGPLISEDAVVCDSALITEDGSRTEPHPFAQVALPAHNGSLNPCVRTDPSSAPDHRILDENPLFDPATLPEDRVLDHHSGLDDAVAVED